MTRGRGETVGAVLARVGRLLGDVADVDEMLRALAAALPVRGLLLQDLFAAPAERVVAAAGEEVEEGAPHVERFPLAHTTETLWVAWRDPMVDDDLVVGLMVLVSTSRRRLQAEGKLQRALSGGPSGRAAADDRPGVAGARLARALVIDANGARRELMVSRLNAMGLAVVGDAGELDEAVAMAAGLQPDVVLLNRIDPDAEEPIPGLRAAAPHALTVVHDAAELP